MALKSPTPLGPATQPTHRGNVSLGLVVVNTDITTATVTPTDVTDNQVVGVEAAIRPCQIPPGTRFIDFHVALSHTVAAQVATTQTIINAFGKPRVIKSLAALPEDLDSTNFDGLSPYDPDGSPYWLPLYDPENSSYDLTLSALTADMLVHANDATATNGIWRGVTGRKYVLSAGCSELHVAIKTAAVGLTSGAFGQVLAHFWG